MGCGGAEDSDEKKKKDDGEDKSFENLHKIINNIGYGKNLNLNENRNGSPNL